jgi:hypothetical protein
MDTLYSKILGLKQENSELTCNPILDAFSLDMCQETDAEEDDSFIKDKKNKILTRLNNCKVGYDAKLKPSLDAYTEVVTYILLKSKGFLVERVPERNTQKTPDFKVSSNGEIFFIEMKTLGFAEGELNYLKAIDSGLAAEISLEEQIKSGKTVAISETSFNPLGRDRPDYEKFRQKYFIETIVKKIDQNLKKKQFELGKTILLIDLSLILIADWMLDSLLYIKNHGLAPWLVGGSGTQLLASLRKGYSRLLNLEKVEILQVN